ncbi:hypothetical protein [Pseudomonas aeruginosa]|uniref:hypothetical protein n=1 Tax=Pseudomonas aeruginosa TaxID=287 RepID=UPI001C969516|nr:hypothetical protein [Pseudomonas aeruginosa]
MNKANECTCPSGDGSLVHPCPAHPAVEQAGGDEHAAFNRWIAEQQLCQGSDISLFKLERNGALVSLHELLRDAYQAGQARAALAQSSPAQAEAERPEVVAYLFVKPDGTLSMDAVRHKPSQPAVAVMTVAQHERIVGELRADRDSWAEQAEQRLADWDEMRKERDAALARVAKLTATRNRYGVDAHYFNKNLQRILRDFESFTPDELARSLIILAKVADEKVVAQAQQLHDLDKQCRDDVARALGLRPNQERGFAWSYLLASIKSCVKASGDSAQAQHSGPDGASDLCRFLAKLYCELDGLRYSTAKLPAEQIADALIFKWPVLQGARNQLNIKRISEQPYDESKLHSAIAAMLAAAPGKEGA